MKNYPNSKTIKGYERNYFLDGEGNLRRVRTNKLVNPYKKSTTVAYIFHDNTFHRLIDLWVESGLIEIPHNSYITFIKNRFNLQKNNLIIKSISEREKEVSFLLNQEAKMVNEYYFLTKKGKLFKIDDNNNISEKLPIINSHKKVLQFNYDLDGFPISSEADRLVAKYWVKNNNPNEFFDVIHIDNNYYNIEANNLEWGIIDYEQRNDIF